MSRDDSICMSINGVEIKVSMAAYDGCHKIYIPVEGQEDQFIWSMVDNDYIWDEDFFSVKSAEDLLEMYLSSCSLRFIQQIDYSSNEAEFTDIIPQCAFCDEEGFFSEELAKEAFMTL